MEKDKKIIKLKKIEVKNNTIYYDYDISGNLNSFFNLDNKLSIKYNLDISDIPEDILAIPFVTGILPMIYLENITIYINNLDKDFCDAFENLRKGYNQMLPKGNWNGKLIVKNKIDHQDNPIKNKTSMFYSGGVDSNCTLALHASEKPEFILIWGSDILQNNQESWETAKSIASETADLFDINTNFISSNFRFYINENALTTKYRDLLPVSWWYDVQHGVALLGHVAPIAYKKKINTHYIPSSYSIYDKNIVCASCPILDEKMKFCGCHVKHDGFELTRLQKVKKICEFQEKINKKIIMRVCCTERNREINCCRCEKCYRTICEIIACKKNPVDFGFGITKKEIKQIKKYLKTSELQGTTIRHWKEIQKQMKLNSKYFKNKKYIKWLLNFNFDKVHKKDFKKEIWDENGQKIESYENNNYILNILKKIKRILFK